MARPGVDTLIEMLEPYLRRLRYSKETIRHYNTALRSLMNYVTGVLGRRPKLTELTFKRMQAWLDGLCDTGLAASTLGVKRASLVCFFDFLIWQERIKPEEDCTRRLLVPPIGRRPKVFVTHEVATAIANEPFAHLAEGETPGILALRDYTLLWLLYEGCFRVSELARLKISDLVWDEPRGGFLLVRVVGKGEKPRDVPVRHCAPLVRAFLARRHEMNPVAGEQALFTNYLTGKGISGGAVSKRVCYYSRRAGHPIHAHMLRHTGATLSLLAGAAAPAIQDNLGHDSADTTRLYTGTNTQFIIDKALLFHPANREYKEELERAKREEEAGRMAMMGQQVGQQLAQQVAQFGPQFAQQVAAALIQQLGPRPDLALAA